MKIGKKKVCCLMLLVKCVVDKGINMTYTEKYRPNELCDVVGQQQHVTYLSKWASEWTNSIPKYRAVILYGKAGIGKTSIAHALAHEMKWDIIELNASDQRTAGVINRIAGSASRTGTLEDINGRKLIILDEADNVHGTSDRGGSKALISLIKNTLQPIIIIVNNFYKLDISLRNICKNLQFKNVSSIDIKMLLNNICEKENIDIDEKVVGYIAKNSNGDIRAALNDLESICVGKKEVKYNDIITNNQNDDVNSDENKRNVSENIFTFVEKVFKEKDIKKVLELSGNIGENPENTIFWLDENIPLVHKKADDLYEAYNLLSKADIFLGRVHRRQNYGMWKYANTLICGVNTVQDIRSKGHSGFVRYSPPKYFSKLKQSKPNRNIKKSVTLKIGSLCHISSSKVNEMLWFIKNLMKNKEHSILISYELDFNLNEIVYLLDCKSNSKKAKDIYDIISKLKEDSIELDEINETVCVIKETIVVDKDKPNAQMSLDDF